jgi:hypothetical protein
MSVNVESEKAIEIIKNYKSSSNKDLMFVMDYIQKDFNFFWFRANAFFLFDVIRTDIHLIYR